MDLERDDMGLGLRIEGAVVRNLQETKKKVSP